MQPYDIFMLIVLVGATVFGAWKGLAWQVASLSSIFLSYFIAHAFSDQVAGMIDASPPWNKFVAMLILFIGTSLIVWLAFRFVSDAIDRVKLKEFDHQIGALLGIAKGVLLCVIITLFAVTLLGEAQRQKIMNSRSGYYIAVILDRSHAVMPSELHDVLDPYIHSLDDRLGDEERFSEHDHDSQTQYGYQPQSDQPESYYPSEQPATEQYTQPTNPPTDNRADETTRGQSIWDTARDALFNTERR